MNNDSETFENAVDSQIAKWWGIGYPGEWNSLGAKKGDGDVIRNNLRRGYRALTLVSKRKGGKRKRRRKTKNRRKKNRKKRTKRRR